MGGERVLELERFSKNMALKSNFQERVIQILTWSLLWVERKECLIVKIIFLISKKSIFRMLLTRKCFKNMRKPPSRSAEKSLSKNSNSDGFKVVKGAPWQGAS